MPDRFANGDPSNDDPAISKGLFDRSKARYYHGGDLQGVIDHLPYLKDLGVTALWINPVYDNVNHLNEREKYEDQAITDYHGYGAVDFYAVDEHLGDLGKLRELTDQAHARRHQGDSRYGGQPHRARIIPGWKIRRCPPGSTARRRIISTKPGKPGPLMDPHAEAELRQSDARWVVY